MHDGDGAVQRHAHEGVVGGAAILRAVDGSVGRGYRREGYKRACIGLGMAVKAEAEVELHRPPPLVRSAGPVEPAIYRLDGLHGVRHAGSRCLAEDRAFPLAG